MIRYELTYLNNAFECKLTASTENIVIFVDSFRKNTSNYKNPVGFEFTSKKLPNKIFNSRIAEFGLSTLKVPTTSKFDLNNTLSYNKNSGGIGPSE
uniref:Uncharacterized protein n=1 Tax=Strongyloides papillosus TaxID=174720 RepID=A0A0N5BW30_STREA